jgi:hypothetical protein
MRETVSVTAYRSLRARFAVSVGAAFIAAGTIAAQRAPDNQVAARFQQLTRASVWTLERSQPLAFRTYHPQGLVKIGDTLFISSVEIRVPTRRSANRSDGFDRDAGEGVGHLFKVTSAGTLVQDLVLGEGTMYHPSGIDFDGTHIWVALAEYRPNSRSIVYRVDPTTMKATEMLRFDDHLGGVVRNTDDNTLHAVSWGSRWFYRWTLDKAGRPTDKSRSREKMRTPNPSHYVDYQDCKYAGDGRMLCSGIADITRGNGEAPLQLGGIDLIDLRIGLPVHQLPVGLTTANGIILTRNPSFFEAAGDGVRAYFLPEDDKSTLYVYRIGTAKD